MSIATFTRRDGRIWLELTAPAISIGLTDDDAAQLLLTLSSLVGGDLPPSQIDLPPSHPEVPHLPGWTRVVDALPDMERKVSVLYKDKGVVWANHIHFADDLDWETTATYPKTHWRYV